jgi:hydroxyethylthiazole kinase-like uncharacterized protein yjeF
MPPRTPDSTLVTPQVLRAWPLPEPTGGKNARGSILVIGGSSETLGAVLLAAEAALRAGAGKLRLATDERAAAALAVAVPEAAVVGLATEDGELAAGEADRLREEAAAVDAVLVGTGTTDPGATVALLGALLPGVDRPVVVDALGSAYLTEHGDGLHHLDGRAVLTVNPTELARTAGVPEEQVDEDPGATAAEVARRSRVVVLCGGTAKHVAAPDGRCWRIEGGGPGLGVSGSGDVQAGIVAGLLARGAEPAQAAVWGGYLHARVGERLAAEVGAVGYLARELPTQVPHVLTELA